MNPRGPRIAVALALAALAAVLLAAALGGHGFMTWVTANVCRSDIAGCG
jgi:hypothetical protein